MTTLRQWILPLLRDSLTDYLNCLEHNLSPNEISNFTYDCDPSNLRITLNLGLSENVIVEEPYKASSGIRAVVSDGYHTIQALITNSPGIDKNQKRYLSLNEIKNKNVLKIARPEFRISHCFEPPAVEMHLVLVEKVQEDKTSSGTPLSTPGISTDDSVQALLHRYGQSHRSEQSSESPASIKSQNLYASAEAETTGSDLENQDSDKSSQPQFTTQIPITNKPVKARKVLQELNSQMHTNAKDATQTLASESYGNEAERKRLLELFLETHKVPSKSGESRDISGNQCGVNISLGKRISQASGSSKQTEASHGTENNLELQSQSLNHLSSSRPFDATPNTFVSQHQRTDSLAPKLAEGTSKTQTQPEQEGRKEGDQTTSAIQRFQSPQDVRQMPDLLLGHFQRWRKEALLGRYIPRYVSKIERDQHNILASKSCFQPPLVGHDRRPGDIPMKLLSKIVAKADASAAKQILLPEEVLPSQQNKMHIVPSKAGAESSINIDIDSSQEVTSTFWPSSPVRPTIPRLPLDSSPSADSCESPVERNENPVTEMTQPPSTINSLLLAESISQVENNGHHDSLISQPEIRLDMSESGILGSQHQPQLSDAAQSSPCKIQSSTSHTDQDQGARVQIKRTPHPNHKPRSHPAQNTSPRAALPPRLESFPMSSFVPGTYDEVREIEPLQHSTQGTSLKPQLDKMKSQDLNHKDTVVEETYVSKRYSLSEIGPKEKPSISSQSKQHSTAQAQSHDQQTSRPIGPKTSEKDSPITRSESMHNPTRSSLLEQTFVESDRQPNSLRSSTINSLPFVRKVFEDSDAATQHQVPKVYIDVKPSKRLRDDEITSSVQKKMRESHSEDPAYEAIWQARRDDRRRILSALGKPRLPPHRRSSSMTSSEEGDNVSRIFEENKGKASNQDSDIGIVTPTTTPITPASVYLKPRSTQERRGKPTYTQNASDHNEEAYLAVFVKFRSEYSDYAGEVSHFREACGVLKNLQALDEAPHPFLYDDFAYHHHHSYMPYLLDASEFSSKKLSYKAFYTTRIKAPSHVKGVITPEFLNDTSIDSSNTAMVSLCDRHQQTRSVANVDEEEALSIHKDSNNIPLSQGHHTHQKPVTSKPANITTQDERNEDSFDDGNVLESQHSSVKLWLEKASGAVSPELGTPAIDRSIETVPTLELLQPTTSKHSLSKPSKPPKSSRRKSASPFVRNLLRRSKKESNWWKDEETPFKKFVRQFNSLPSEKRQHNMLKDQAASHAGSQPLVDIFAWNR